ncbi:hypothetical protein ACLEJQ_18565 [Pseudomonas sp. SMV71]|uniref:hypothetical protein n=1 Tax=unclassified Pseudomonas TaxID=196821 RepID=UPI003F8491FE
MSTGLAYALHLYRSSVPVPLPGRAPYGFKDKGAVIPVVGGAFMWKVMRDE